ncbi:hypothetical protein HID58_066425, partial [Brassica napus]
HKRIAVKLASGQTTVGIDPQVKRIFHLLSATKSILQSIVYVAPCIECHASFWWHGYFSRMHKVMAVESASGQTTVGIDPQLLNLSYNLFSFGFELFKAL